MQGSLKFTVCSVATLDQAIMPWIPAGSSMPLPAMWGAGRLSVCVHGVRERGGEGGGGSAYHVVPQHDANSGELAR